MKSNKYIRPEFQVVNVENSEVIATSPTLTEKPATEGEADASAYRNSLWN